MLYSIIYSMVTLSLCFISFICGYNARRHVDTDTPIITPLKQIFAATPKETDEERKNRTIIENLNNFGTNAPQKEVK